MTNSALKMVTLRMDGDFRARLKSCAEREEMSMNEYCLMSLELVMDGDDEWHEDGKHLFVDEWPEEVTP